MRFDDGTVAPPLPFVVRIADPEPGQVVLHLRGDLDLASVDELQAAVRGALDGHGGANLVLDLRELRFVDSSGVRVVLDLRGERLAAGGRLVLRAAGPAVRRVLSLMALDQLLELED